MARPATSNAGFHSCIIVKNYSLPRHADPIKPLNKRSFPKDKTKNYMDLTLRYKDKRGPLDHNLDAVIKDWKASSVKGPGFSFNKSHKRKWDKL